MTLNSTKHIPNTMNSPGTMEFNTRQLLFQSNTFCYTLVSVYLLLFFYFNTPVRGATRIFPSRPPVLTIVTFIRSTPD